jgi:redox-sensitive bicupin YhaK (pirin superfamily)
MSQAPVAQSPVLQISPLGFPWRTLDPFLFCVHHDDAYPVGNEAMGPAASLAGRDIGQDFGRKDGWSMYHGDQVPGFPQHPHRGFETVTIVREGLIDHSDSLGATARFGGGDVQWLTAGKGIQHSEMFPLVHKDKTNPVELFQIWLNLPSASKMVPPYFSMLWNETLPRTTFQDASGHTTQVTVVAGALVDVKPLAPPPDSWAARPNSDVAIWTLKMEPGARWTLPRAAEGLNRVLYFFKGSSLEVEGTSVPPKSAVTLRSNADAVIVNGNEACELLLLQGRPIGEPVAQHGPFVMNSTAELRQAFIDYQRTEFGGWPWPKNGPVHPREESRFARHPDGRIERAEKT